MLGLSRKEAFTQGSASLVEGTSLEGPGQLPNGFNMFDSYITVIGTGHPLLKVPSDVADLPLCSDSPHRPTGPRSVQSRCVKLQVKHCRT